MHRTQIILSYPEDFAEEIKKRAKAKFMKVNGYIESLITEAGERARAVIKSNLEKLEVLKNKLLEKETVEAAEVLELLKGTVMPKAASLY